MEREENPNCPYPGCFFCSIKESNPVKRKNTVAKFFKDFPTQDEDGQVLPISGLWNTAMLKPSDPDFINLGIFECMSSLISKGLNNKHWLARDQNIYIPYYAAHIIGSYTMVVEEFAERAVQEGVIPPLVELLRGRLTWVEQRVAIRALGHLATYKSTFSKMAEKEEILNLAMELATNALDIVYTQFYQFPEKRLDYHCDLLTRGLGGMDTESKKAEEWASQLQCWALQLINCFAFREDFIPSICNMKFLSRLLGMWGGLVNESSPAGLGLLRTLCHHKMGRMRVLGCQDITISLCNLARSSDDWQYMAVDCLLCLVEDQATRIQVLDKVIVALADLAELIHSRDHKKIAKKIAGSLFRCGISLGPASISPTTKAILSELSSQLKRIQQEKCMTMEDIQIRRAAALVIKLEGNAKFFSGDICGAACKYTEGLMLCPFKARKARVALYSNRAQCHLLMQNPEAAVSDATRALCLHNPFNGHGKSLWRRAQAYACLNLNKESLLDAILYMGLLSQSSDDSEQRNIPAYVNLFVKKQMQATWLFRDAAVSHGGGTYTENAAESDSEWETASEISS